jgi:hypothetical protein
VIPGELDAEPRRDGIEHADAFGHHFLADTVTGNDGNSVFRHLLAPSFFVSTYERPGLAIGKAAIHLGRACKFAPSLPHTHFDG